MLQSCQYGRSRPIVFVQNCCISWVQMSYSVNIQFEKACIYISVFPHLGKYFIH